MENQDGINRVGENFNEQRAKSSTCPRIGWPVLPLARLSTFALTANFFRGETPRDGAVCRESSRIEERNAV